MACDTGIHQARFALDAAPTGVCLDALGHDDLPWLRENVFRKSCALSSSCHMGNRPAGNLSLIPGRAYSSLVGVAADAVSGWVRVVPGDPEHSYLMVKLGAIDGPLGKEGGLMPLNNPLLCPEVIGAIRRWIVAGALEEPPDAGVPDAGPAAVDAMTDGGTAD